MIFDPVDPEYQNEELTRGSVAGSHKEAVLAWYYMVTMQNKADNRASIVPV
jgi:hypothetical protein